MQTYTFKLTILEVFFDKYRTSSNVILECSYLFKTTNVSKNNKLHPNIASKNLAIKVF